MSLNDQASRHSVGGFVFVVALGAVLWLTSGSQKSVLSQTSSLSGNDSLHVLTSTLANGVQQVVVVDDARRTMAVYKIDPSDGHIQLASVRALNFDLTMQEFNTKTPLPSELQKVQP